MIHNKFSGMLFRTFSELDLEQLHSVSQAIQQKLIISEIDPESVVCAYEGHTIFSIFWDNKKVYELIRDQTKAIKEADEDQDGQEDNSNYMRRLYRILNLPVGDIKSIKKRKEGRT